MKKTVYSLVVAFLILIVGQMANAQCVGCSASDTGFNCTSQTSGGNSCSTSNDRRSCTVTGLCKGKKPIADFADYFYRPVNFSRNAILGVAASHPGFAATLIQLQGRTLAELNVGQISWMPGEIYYKDIEQMLDPNADKEALAKTLQTRDRNALQQGYKPISYSIAVEKTPNGQSVVLRIQRNDTFPSLHDAYTSLEINIGVTNATSLTDNAIWKLR
jgi:hypothetical protein